MEAGLPAPLTFEIEITLSNQKDHEVSVFLGSLHARSVEELMQGPLMGPVERGLSMLDERADDGDFWALGAECRSVRSEGSPETDWTDDMLPQRNEVSRVLERHLATVGT